MRLLQLVKFSSDLRLSLFTCLLRLFMNLLTSEYFKVECMHAKLNNMTFSVFSS